MDRSMPKSGEIYRHFRGRRYQILHIAVMTETRKQAVVYRAYGGNEEAGQVYATKLENFMAVVDREKYPEAEQRYRFEKCDGISDPVEVPEGLEDSGVKAGDGTAEGHGSHSRTGEEAGDGTEKGHDSPSRTGEDVDDENGTEEMKLIMEFLDLEYTEDKIQFLYKHRGMLTGHFLAAAAESMDYIENSDSLEDRYEGFLRFLKVKAQYESRRLRG